MLVLKYDNLIRSVPFDLESVFTFEPRFTRAKEGSMKSVYDYQDFRSFLEDELNRRVNKNGHYSMRSFARDLQVSHSRLSEFLTGKTMLSLRSIDRACTGMALPTRAKNYFLDLNRASAHRNTKMRASAKKRVDEEKRSRQISRLNNLDAFEDPNDIAIIMLLTLPEPAKLAHIAETLRRTPAELKSAISRLSDAGFIIKEGEKWTRGHSIFSVNSPKPSKSIQAFHKHYLSVASKTIETVDVNRRKFQTWIFQCEENRLEEARKDVAIFCESFISKYSEADKVDSVNVLTVQLYPLESPK